ncbi:hypothetical protein DL990_27240 [Amycolatopsis sp. WAC 01416]|uniref:hypothetical protein n=1 Tax=Amycolatopsis sp. WAC 01416 TaxID=2203196 RepID=UPI000F7937CD|nr:hypothetical protein [Amycolatopsis sp. WAC 01416]RSN28374.1 hypothetical protein DL990_27240 [Amycolatopsis sp. WAC 01416]
MTAHSDKMFGIVLNIRGAPAVVGAGLLRDHVATPSDTSVTAWSAYRESPIHNASMELRAVPKNHAVMPFRLLTGRLTAHSKMPRETSTGSLE